MSLNNLTASREGDMVRLCGFNLLEAKVDHSAVSGAKPFAD